MNSMPARCKAVWIALTASSESNLRSFSESTTVDRPNLATRASCDWVMPRKTRRARDPSGRTWASRFFELDLLEQQIRDELSEPAILHLQLGHNVSPPALALGAMTDLGGHRRRGRREMIELAPAMERHDADAQRLGDLALHPAIGGERLGLLELGGDFSGRMSPGLHGSFPPDIGGPLQACPRDACRRKITGAFVNNNRCLTGQTTINA